MGDFSPSLVGKVLVVDDDPTAKTLIKASLEEAGFEVWQAASAKEALTLLDLRGFPHIGVIDIRMPEMNGLELAEKILEIVDLPLIMVTAVDDDETVVQTIDTLAEDYIKKPFSPGELVARVRRLLRRVGSFSYVQGSSVRVDDRFSVAFQRRQLTLDDRKVELTPIETKLLYLLMRAGGRVVTPRYLLERVWPLEEVFEDSLRSHIYRLRRKLDLKAGSRKYVVTERGVGYRFAFPSR